MCSHDKVKKWLHRKKLRLSKNLLNFNIYLEENIKSKNKINTRGFKKTSTLDNRKIFYLGFLGEGEGEGNRII